MVICILSYKVKWQKEIGDIPKASTHFQRGHERLNQIAQLQKTEESVETGSF